MDGSGGRLRDGQSTDFHNPTVVRVLKRCGAQGGLLGVIETKKRKRRVKGRSILSRLESNLTEIAKTKAFQSKGD